MGWIQTYSGEKFDFKNPTPDMINIGDIAHSLAYQCRYNGHTNRHYSVAEHSILMSHLVPGHLSFLALMHDAVEAYVGDLPRPFKEMFPEWEQIEESIWAVIAHKYDLPFHIPDEVKDLDKRICLTERIHFMADSDHDWGIEGDAPVIVPMGWDADVAEHQFMARYLMLKP